ncbi:calmodulin [Syncephalastrum racemosum]|uniref:Calmodulin n=1 Tax=Syncephalastrum racemosum TaxID=13706 RepID=A0A1X2HJF5_SYNRA|nr:calmodulin [Syncephalastrum racemosum]
MSDRFTLQQVTEFRETFKVFDKDGNGFIDATELGDVMQSLHMNATESELKDMIADADSDGSGTIDFEEFLAMMSRKVDVQDDAREAFRLFDRDENGRISVTELRDVMQSVGEVLSFEDLEKMIREADINGDGGVDYDEFAKMLARGALS